MSAPLSEKTLAEIREHVQQIRDKHRDEGASTAELVLGIDIQSLLLASERSRAESARLRAKLDDWRRILRGVADDGTLEEAVGWIRQARAALEKEG
jgi:hypothetical protein